jgi:hypothetical protein
LAKRYALVAQKRESRQFTIQGGDRPAYDDLFLLQLNEMPSNDPDDLFLDFPA